MSKLATWLPWGRVHAPNALQLAGVGGVVAGVFLLWGLAITLLVGGVLAVGVGVLFERET